MSDSSGSGFSDLDDMDDLELIMQQVQSEQEQQEAAEERMRHRNYIYQEPLIVCTGNGEIAQSHGMGNFARGSGANNDLTVLNNSSLFDDLLDDITLVAPFEFANSEKNALFKRKQESARKDIERAFGVLHGVNTANSVTIGKQLGKFVSTNFNCLTDSLESKYMAEDSSSKKFLVDAIAWWIDSDATTHVCKDRFWFKTYKPIEDGSVLYMGDDHFAPGHGKGSVALEFSSGKTVTLFNVLYVPKLRKNLVSGPMLNKCGYKQVYESDKYILSKSGVFVGFGYYNNGMFMLNLIKVPDDSDSVYMSSFTIVNSLLWHARAIVRFPDPKQKTLGEKGIDCIFVGYAEHSTAYSIEEDPRTYNEAMQSQDSAFWKEAIDDEIGSIMENNTWVLSDLPRDCKPLGCKWIFKRKMKVDGTVDKFKARLVIQGFRKRKGSITLKLMHQLLVSLLLDCC
nr:zinc finger, CCHC-type [Tanacetum cinerariifolium]